MRNFRTNEPIDVDIDKCMPKFYYFDTLKTLKDCISKEQTKLEKMKIGDLLFLRKEKEIYCLVDHDSNDIKNFVLVARKGE